MTFLHISLVSKLKTGKYQILWFGSPRLRTSLFPLGIRRQKVASSAVFVRIPIKAQSVVDCSQNL